MNKRFLTLAGVAAVLSVGTYVGLNIVKPYKHEEPKVADVTSPDQVFGASVDNPEAHANEATPAGAAPAPVEAAAAQPSDTAVQPASPDQGGSAPAPTGEAPAAATASAAGGSSAPLVPAGTPGSAPAATSSESTAASAPAAEPAAAPAPAPEPAPAAAAAAEPAPAPTEVAAAPAEKPKKKAHSAAKSSSKSSSGSGAKVWWPAPKDDKLSLVYAGSASYKKAVVLMFNGAFFKADTVNANIKVTDKSGKAVTGEVGENNLRMVVFPVSAAGTYKVSIAPGLTDNKGRKLGSKLSGSVSIK